MSTSYEWREAPAADFAVIGSPVAHSRSPLMHTAALRALGLEATYLAIEVPSGEVEMALAHLSQLGYRGVNVTVPHKLEASRACRTVDAFAARAGAVNTVSLPDLKGSNTDGPGFIATLRDRNLIDGEVLLLGAGGTSRALALALSDAGYRLRIYNRTRRRAEDMIDQLGIVARIVEEPDAENADVVVNATSASLHGESIAIDWSRSPRWTIAYDVMYGRTESPFLAAARAVGRTCVDGVPLLAAQGAASLQIWLGVDAPRALMEKAVRCAL